MKRLSIKQELVFELCGDPSRGKSSRVHKRTAGAGAPYSWALEGVGMCSTQTRILHFKGYIELGGTDTIPMVSVPWMITDRGREYRERFPL